MTTKHIKEVPKQVKQFYITVSAPNTITGEIHITDGNGGYIDISSMEVARRVFIHNKLVDALREIYEALSREKIEGYSTREMFCIAKAKQVLKECEG